MNLPNKRPVIPSLLLEQWRLGELGEERKKALREEFGDERIQKALAELEAEDAAFVRPPLAQTLPLAPKPSPWRVAAPWLVAACAVLAIFAGTRWSGSDAPDSILLKGGRTPLVAYRSEGSQAIPVRDNDQLQAGDVIQFAFDAGGFPHGAIVALDGRMNITWLFPEDSVSDGPLKTQSRIILDHAYKLDDAPSFERFFLVRSMKPIDRSELESHLRRAAENGKTTLEHPDWDVFSFSIRK